MFLASVSWESQISKNCYFFFISPDFHTCIPQPLKIKFLHQELNRKHNSSEEVVRWNTCELFVASESWYVDYSQKNPTNFFSRHSISYSFFTDNYRLNFFYRSCNDKPLFCKNVSNGKILNFFPCIGTNFQIFQKMHVTLFHLGIQNPNSP